MRPIRALAALAVLIAVPAAADEAEETARFAFGGDVFAAGEAPELRGGEADDLFAVGETLRPRLSLTGSAHLAGRVVTVLGPVAGDVYAAGQDVRLEAEIGGDATLAGWDVVAAAPVGGDLRVAARTLSVEAPVSGSLLAGAERIEINAVISGDARLDAEEVRFGPGARIDGRLVLVEDAAAGGPPPAVVPPERVERREAPARGDEPGWSLGAAIAAAVSFLLGTVLVVLAAQALLLGVAPRWSEEMAFDLGERPAGSLGWGFLTLAALAGAVPLLAVTVIGAPLIPLVLLAAGLAVLLGYALGAWGLGAAVWRGLNRPAPGGFGARLGVAAIGLAAALALGLVPFVGWLFAVALTLAGLGAASADRLRPSLAAPRA